MSRKISRREFLKLGGLTLGSLALSDDFPPGQWEYEPGLIGRVAYQSVSVFDEPVLDARTTGYRFRDELINIYEIVTPLTGPAYNPVWYRVWGGYVHSAFIQLAEVKINALEENIPQGGLLTELTVPYSQPYNFSTANGWEPNEDFYLYYQSTHWITDIVEGPNGLPWYQITDELWEKRKYYVPAGHLRAFSFDELSPISGNLPAGDKHIEVSLTYQVLTAYEGDDVVLRTQISSGIDRPSSGRSSKTPLGVHYIESKMPSKHMGASRLTDTLEDRALPGVPWTAFFATGGYALHGTYWHNNFGVRMSLGCVNMRNDDSLWLFRWTDPVWDPHAVSDPTGWEKRGRGTRVVVVE